MLKDSITFSSFSTNDVARTKEFYANVLGLVAEDSMGGVQLKLAGGRQVFIYHKPDHVPAGFTVLNFIVPSVEQAVDELVKKGVKFEIYDQENIKTDERGISKGSPGEGPTIAWFKDPAGNFLSLLEESSQ